MFFGILFSCPCKGWVCVEPILLMKMWASWGFVIILFPGTFKKEPLSGSLSFTIDLFLQGNQTCEPLMQTLENEGHEKVKGQQTLPLILLPQQQKTQVEASFENCGLWRRYGHPNSLPVFPFRFYLVSGFDSHFFQGTLLGWLQGTGGFRAMWKL